LDCQSQRRESVTERHIVRLLKAFRHSIVGGIIGVGIAALGADGVQWGWKGVSSVFAAWFIAPGIAGGFAIIVFGITKYGVLERKDPLKKGLMMIPVYFGITSAVLTMVIVWKGAASLDLDDWTAGQILGTSHIQVLKFWLLIMHLIQAACLV